MKKIRVHYHQGWIVSVDSLGDDMTTTFTLGVFKSLDEAITCAQLAAKSHQAQVFYRFPTDTLEPDDLFST